MYILYAKHMIAHQCAIQPMTHTRLKRMFSAWRSTLHSPLRPQESFLTVDIGSSAIKLIELRTSGDHLELLNWGSIPTPAAAIQSHMVVAPDRVANAVRTFIQRRGICARQALTAVPGPAVMMKRITIPTQRAEDAEEPILAAARAFIPEELTNVAFDCDISDSRADADEIEVQLVAAKNDMVEELCRRTTIHAGTAPDYRRRRPLCSSKPARGESRSYRRTHRRAG